MCNLSTNTPQKNIYKKSKASQSPTISDNLSKSTYYEIKNIHTLSYEPQARLSLLKVSETTNEISMYKNLEFKFQF